MYYSLVIHLGCHLATENNIDFVLGPKPWLWVMLLLLYEPLRLNLVEYTRPTTARIVSYPVLALTEGERKFSIFYLLIEDENSNLAFAPFLYYINFKIVY